MKKKAILLALTIILSLQGCQSVNPEKEHISTPESAVLSDNESGSEYFSAEIVDAQIENKSKIFGTCDGNVFWSDFTYIDDVSTYEIVGQPETEKPLKNGFTGVYYAADINEKIFIYGHDESSDYRFDVFDSSMSEYYSIDLSDDRYSYGFEAAVSENEEIYLLADKDGSYFINKLSSEGQLLNSVELNNIVSTTGLSYVYVAQIYALSSGDIAVNVSIEDEDYICIFDNNLNLKSIINDSTLFQNPFIYEADGHFIIEDSDYDGNQFFYCADDVNDIWLMSDQQVQEFNLLTESSESDEEDYGYEFEFMLDGNPCGIKDNTICEEKIKSYLIESGETRDICSFSYRADNIQHTFYSSDEKNGIVSAAYAGTDNLINIQNTDYTSGKCDNYNFTCDNENIIDEVVVKNGFVYVIFADEDYFDKTLEIYDLSGEKIFSTENSPEDGMYLESYCLSENNDIILAYYNSYEDKMILKSHNIESAKTSELEISRYDSENITGYFKGSGKYSFFALDDRIIYGYFISDNTLSREMILDLSFTSLSEEDIVYEFYYENENIMYVTTDNFLYRLMPSEIPDSMKYANKTVINLACIDVSPDEWINKYFEGKNTEYKVNAVIYDTSDENFQRNWDMMLISDDSPDILMYNPKLTKFNPYRDNNKRAYCDLYDMIDSDANMTRNDFQKNILQAMEYKGALYQITPFFNISTLIGYDSDGEDANGWSIADFCDFAANNKTCLFPYSNRESFERVVLNLIPYYDKIESKAFFDRDDFKNMVSMCSEFPEDCDISDEFMLYYADIYDFTQENYIKKSYFNGKNIENKGLPGVDGNGAIIIPDIEFSILKSSRNAEISWEYIKSYFTEEYMSVISEYNSLKFSVITRYIEEMKKDAKELPSDVDNGKVYGYDINKNQIEIGVPDDNSIDFIMDIISGAKTVYTCDNRIQDIFYEEYFTYINDQDTTIDEFAENVQKKVTIYLNESR